MQELKRFGVDRPEIILTSDPAIGMQPAEKWAVDRFMTENGLDPAGSYMCICLRRWPGFESRIREIARAIEYAYRKHGMTPVFLSINRIDDNRAAERVAEQMSRVPYHIISSPMDSHLTIGIIARMRIMVSMRLHGLIFAAGQGLDRFHRPCRQSGRLAGRPACPGRKPQKAGKRKRTGSPSAAGGRYTEGKSMIRGAVLAEGRSYQLQAVIAPQEDSPALSKARSAGVAGTVVDPDLFPSTASYCKAVSNKLKDMDIDLVILADYSMPLGEVTKRFRNRIIAVCPCLIPAFENFKGDMYQVLHDRGIKIAGATAYFTAEDGGIGPIILQKAVDLEPGMSREAIYTKIREDAESVILPEAVKLFCANKLECDGNLVRISGNK